MSGECVREKYLNEYIADLDIDENVKKRMLDLCDKANNEISERDRYLKNCHMRIEELEMVVSELGIELAKAKNFIRKHM